MRHVARLVAGRGELRRERLAELHEALGAVAAHEPLLEADVAAALVVGDRAGIPEQHAARMHDQERGDR